MTKVEKEEFRIDACETCLEAFGGHFFDSKPKFFRECFFCKHIEETQNFKVKIADEDPPNENEDTK